MNFNDLRVKVTRNAPCPHMLLALDPGHTTGYAFFKDGELFEFGQIANFESKNNNLLFENIESIITRHKLDIIVCENYKVYSHKLKEHSYSEVQTLRIIGIYQYLAYKKSIPIQFQMASEAKGFCTDDKLKSWDMYITGLKHCRDSIRHGCYYLLFKGR